MTHTCRWDGRVVPFDLAGMFDFSGKRNGKLFLNPTTGQRQK
jgi:hypothetical protein